VCDAKGQRTRCPDYLERALKLDPNYYPALINLAQLKYRRGELDAARNLVGRYNKLAEPTAESCVACIGGLSAKLGILPR